ncbi:MAG: helix-turn-helix transcriptional regulator [Planctomycetales bacterium]|nr:helix-turn-helix transcriptional regulator [Planctomycetales bacterium]
MESASELCIAEPIILAIFFLAFSCTLFHFPPPCEPSITMNPRYVTLIDSEGCLAAIIPFHAGDRSYDNLLGTRLGSTSLTDEDKSHLLRAYGEALVDQSREHVEFRWTQDRGETRLEIDVMRFPSVHVSAIMLSEVISCNAPASLTNREMTVLEMSANDATDGEIAQRLKIARATVSRHKQNIRNKLGVREWAGAVGKAIRLGLI